MYVYASQIAESKLDPGVENLVYGFSRAWGALAALSYTDNTKNSCSCSCLEHCNYQEDTYTKYMSTTATDCVHATAEDCIKDKCHFWANASIYCFWSKFRSKRASDQQHDRCNKMTCNCECHGAKPVLIKKSKIHNCNCPVDVLLGSGCLCGGI